MTTRRNGEKEPREVIDLAARGEARAAPALVRHKFGLPVGVSRVVDLPRAPIDREWDQLISIFRTAFGVHGRVSTSGGIREWSHGNLHIAVEPTECGEQLRIADLKEDAVAINGLGVGLGGMAVVAGSVVAADGQPHKALAVLGMFGAMSLAAFIAAHLTRTPLWARERERQMEEIVQRAITMLSKS